MFRAGRPGILDPFLDPTGNGLGKRFGAPYGTRTRVSAVREIHVVLDNLDPHKPPVGPGARRLFGRTRPAGTSRTVRQRLLDEAASTTMARFTPMHCDKWSELACRFSDRKEEAYVF